MDKINLELEKTILCGCLLDKSALMKAAEIIAFSDFQKPEHSTFFKALLDVPQGVSWDVISVGQDIRDRQKVGKAIGGAAYLLEIVQSDYTSANIVFHCRKLKELSLIRQKKTLFNAQAQSPAEDEFFQAELQKISAELEKLKSINCDSIALKVCDLIEAGIEGKRQVVSTPWRRIDDLSAFLMAGTVALFCGNVGAAKSFMILQLCVHLVGLGVKFAIWELEETTEYHVLRALAQFTGIASLTNPGWCQLNPEAARASYMENVDFINAIGNSMTDSPDTQPTLNQIALWIERKAHEGCRVVIIDPVSLAAHTQKEVWQEDNSFVDAVKKTAARYGCTVVLVTHPVKTVSMPDVSQLSGGVAFSRACQTVLWLQSHEPQSSAILTDCGSTEIEHARTLHILKSRNSGGQGKRLAFELVKENLTLREGGVLCKRTKQ